MRGGGRVLQRALEWFSRRLLPESEAPGGEGGAAEFVYFGAHPSVFSFSVAVTGKE